MQVKTENNLNLSSLEKSLISSENLSSLQSKRLEILERQYFDNCLVKQSELEKKILDLQHQNFLLSTQVHHLLNSFSFKLTLPLRRAKSKLKNWVNSFKVATTVTESKGSYSDWIQVIEERQMLAAFKEKFSGEFSGEDTQFIVLLIVDSSNIDGLGATLRSLHDQTYKKYKTIFFFKNNEFNDNQIKEKFASQNINLADYWFSNKIDELNNYLEPLDFDWLLPLVANDQLNKYALDILALQIKKNPDFDLIYSDHDELDISAQDKEIEKFLNPKSRKSPCFKPNWNQYYFFSSHYIDRTFAVKKQIINKTNHFELIDFASNFYSFLLRVIDKNNHKNPSQYIGHISKILWHIQAFNKNLNAMGDSLNNFFSSQNQNIQVVQKSSGLSIYQDFDSGGPHQNPLVSILIPTKDSPEILSRCVLSIFEKSSYKNFEIIIIDNGTSNQLALDFMALLPKDCVKVLKDNHPFNFSSLNNKAAKVAKGDYLCLLNNDIEVISENWIEELLTYAAQPDVACVGAKLLYPNGNIQHAGVILGIGVIAGHQFIHLPNHQITGYHRANLVQELSAVTAACLMVKKSIYQELHGLNQDELKVAFNDVDFCIRALEKGYKNIYNPHAVLYHLESVSRGVDDSAEKKSRLEKETQYMLSKWGTILKNDNAYNPNLSLENENHQLSFTNN